MKNKSNRDGKNEGIFKSSDSDEVGTRKDG